MRIQYVDFDKEAIRHNMCMYFPHGYVNCKNNYNCALCEFADRMRKARPVNVPLFSWGDALPQTQKKGGDNFYYKPVILSSDALRRNNIEPTLANQIMIAVDGSGCFVKNKCGPIDGYLVAEPLKRITVSRNECYGIPNENAARKYDELFFYGISKILKQN